MFKVIVYGRVFRYVEEGVLLRVAHHEDGFRDPVVVRCDRNRELLSRRQHPPGSTLWVEGDAYQLREDDQVRLAVVPAAVSETPPKTIRQRQTSIWCTAAQVRVAGRVTSEVIDEGQRQGLPVCYFPGHVQALPQMPAGESVVLRCRMEGDESQRLGAHRPGDLLNLEGELLEERFTSKVSGMARTAHQLRVRKLLFTEGRKGVEARAVGQA